MTPDIDIKDYYYEYINNAKQDIKDSKEHLKDLAIQLSNLKDEISNNKDLILKTFNINLDEYSDWTDEIPSEELSKTVNKFKTNYDIEHRAILISIFRYIGVIKQIQKCNTKINLAEHRKDLSFSAYREIVKAYYHKVQEFLLKGYGYKFQYYIGTYCINRWKITQESSKLRLDYAATNKRRKELLAQGAELYDDKLAAWYKARNIPYNGIDYRVYIHNDHFYEFRFIHSSIMGVGTVDFKHNEYINVKYRGKSFQEIADELVSKEEDVYNLAADIKYKLNVLLYKFPHKYTNFIRNEEQLRYKH